MHLDGPRALWTVALCSPSISAFIASTSSSANRRLTSITGPHCTLTALDRLPARRVRVSESDQRIERSDIEYAFLITKIILVTGICFEPQPELWLNCFMSPLTHVTAGVYPGKLLPRWCPAVPTQWAEPRPELAASNFSLNGTNDAGQTRAGLGPAQCRCPLWTAIGR
jgi:hypothetical protein